MEVTRKDQTIPTIVSNPGAIEFMSEVSDAEKLASIKLVKDMLVVLGDKLVVDLDLMKLKDEKRFAQQRWLRLSNLKEGRVPEIPVAQKLGGNVTTWRVEENAGVTLEDVEMTETAILAENGILGKWRVASQRADLRWSKIEKIKNLICQLRKEKMRGKRH